MVQISRIQMEDLVFLFSALAKFDGVLRFCPGFINLSRHSHLFLEDVPT